MPTKRTCDFSTASFSFNKGSGVVTNATYSGATSDDLRLTGVGDLRTVRIPIAEESNFDSLIASGVYSRTPAGAALMIWRTTSYIYVVPLRNASGSSATHQVLFNQNNNSGGKSGFTFFQSTFETKAITYV